MSTPSAPDLVHPDCPTCGAEVGITLFDQAIVIMHNSWEGTEVPRPGARHRIVATAADPIPRGYKRVGGAPEADKLALFPCGCILVGNAAHAYQLAALELTYPDVLIQVRLVLPTALSGAGEPSILETSFEISPGDVLAADRLPAETIGRAIRQSGDEIIRAIPRTAGRPA